MAVRIIKKSWWVDFTFNYQRHRVRSPENSRAGALAYEAHLRQKLARGEEINKKTHPTQQGQLFAGFASKWLKEYVVPNNKYSEQRTKKYILDASLVPFFGKIPVGKITSHHIEQYKAHTSRTGVKNKTINNRLTVLRKCLTTAYEWFEFEGTPPKFNWLKCAPPKTDYLTLEESKQLLSHANGVVREMLLTATKTGMRQGELKGLQWSSINWENQTITVRHSRCDYTKELGSPKSNRVRHIPMNLEVYYMLARRKKDSGYVFLDEDGRPFDNQRLKLRLANVCKKAGLRKIGWHTLRHTFASHLVMGGAHIASVQALMGHANLATTMKYTHLSSSTLREAINLLDPK
jgi:site-specific recombinase XerD